MQAIDASMDDNAQKWLYYLLTLKRDIFLFFNSFLSFIVSVPFTSKEG